MPEDVVASYHTHVFKTSPKIFKNLQDFLRLDKPDLAKLVQHSDGVVTKLNSRSGKGSGNSSAASSVKAGSGKTVARKYGAVKTLIGEGGSCVVWLARVKENNVIKEVYAIKGFRKGSDDHEIEFQKNLTMEHQLLSALAHPNIIKTFDLLVGMYKGSICSRRKHAQQFPSEKC